MVFCALRGDTELACFFFFSSSSALLFGTGRAGPRRGGSGGGGGDGHRGGWVAKIGRVESGGRGGHHQDDVRRIIALVAQIMSVTTGI